MAESWTKTYVALQLAVANEDGSVELHQWMITTEDAEALRVELGPPHVITTGDSANASAVAAHGIEHLAIIDNTREPGE